jgi:autotransporter-associated beta strand protein
VPQTLISYASETGTFNVANGVPSADKLVYTPTALEIVANGPSNLNWTNASGNATWDIATSQNWNTTSGTAVTYSDTSNTVSGDNVTFSDNNNGSYSVNVATVVHPTSVTFTNSSGNYTLTGATTSAGISGPGTLTVSGSGSVTLATSNSYTGGTFVSNGTLILPATASFPANTALNISGGSVSIAPANSGNAVGILINNLSLTGSGTLNLNTNEAVIRGGSLSTVWSLAQTGYASGAWNGPGGITSANATAGYITAATSGNGALTAVGVILNDTTGNVGGSSGTALYATFGGATTASGDVLVKYTYYGDTNLDGQVDGSDYANIDNGYENSLTGWYNGDFNYDGAVDGSDYTLMDNAYNSQGAQLASIIASPAAVATDQIAGASSAVPEPASLGLFGIGAMGLLGRRRRK